MIRNRLLAIVLVALGAVAVCHPQAVTAPRIDKQRLENYIRYAEEFNQGVQISIEDPVASPFPNYYRVVVHLSHGAQKKDVVYYATADGQRFINGTIWSLGESPFLD